MSSDGEDSGRQMETTVDFAPKATECYAETI
jgi:hypothetical protein